MVLMGEGEAVGAVQWLGLKKLRIAAITLPAANSVRW